MAVYTDLSDDDLAGFVAQYDIGPLLSCTGIVAGVSNSNFLLMTTAGPFILTLFERNVADKDLPFFMDLMRHLSRHGIQCPLPVTGRDGRSLRRVAGREAALITFLNGVSVRRPSRGHCASFGTTLAKLHSAATDSGLTRENSISFPAWRHLADITAGRADEVAPGLAAGVAAELAFLNANWPSDLPRGVIHGDPFPDNVFFQNDAVSGVIDFYFACTDYLAYDLALAVNAWCFESDRQFNSTKARALVGSYNGERPLEPAEREALPILARGATLRILLTRLFDWLNPAPGAVLKPHDPLEYWSKLKFHQAVRSPAEYGLFE